MVQDLSSLLKQLNINSSIHLVGHSFGGRIAMAFAAHQPTSVRSVVVEDMDLISSQPGGEAAAEKWGQKVKAINQEYPSTEAAIRAIESAYGRDSQLLTHVLSQSFIHQSPSGAVTLISTPFQTYLWGMFARSVDLGFTLKSYRGPVLFLQADQQSSGISPLGLKQILELRPNAQIVSFPGSSHNIHATMPQKFAQILNQFLSLHVSRK